MLVTKIAKKCFYILVVLIFIVGAVGGKQKIYAMQNDNNNEESDDVFVSAEYGDTTYNNGDFVEEYVKLESNMQEPVVLLEEQTNQQEYKLLNKEETTHSPLCNLSETTIDNDCYSVMQGSDDTSLINNTEEYLEEIGNNSKLESQKINEIMENEKVTKNTYALEEQTTELPEPELEQTEEKQSEIKKI